MEQNCCHPLRTDQNPLRYHSRQRHQLCWTLALGNDLLDMVIAGYHFVPVVVHLQPRDHLYLVYKLFRKFQKNERYFHIFWWYAFKPEVKFSIINEPEIRFFHFINLIWGAPLIIKSWRRSWAFYTSQHWIRFISMLG